MADKKYERIDEEKLKEVTIGITMEDEEWVDNIIWESLEGIFYLNYYFLDQCCT